MGRGEARGWAAPGLGVGPLTLGSAVCWPTACVRACVCVCARAHTCSVVSDCLLPHRLQPTRFLCVWDSPGKSTGVGGHSLLQGIFPTQGRNPGLLRLQAGSSLLSHQGSPGGILWQRPQGTEPKTKMNVTGGILVTCPAGGSQVWGPGGAALGGSTRLCSSWDSGGVSGSRCSALPSGGAMLFP